MQVRAVLREAREGGVTTIQDLSSAEQVMAYQELRRMGELTARINIRPQLYRAEEVAALGFSRGFGDDWLRLVGFKAWVDGIMGNSAALFFEPFHHDPKNRGSLRHVMFPEGQEGAAMTMTVKDHYTRFPPGNLEKLIKVAARAGVPPHVHAIGDLGNRILLDVYERVLSEEGLLGTDHRWRVIHAQHVHPEDFARFGRLKLVAEVNPYHISDDMRWMEERIGNERARDAYALRKLKNGGAVLVFGSDSPGTNAARYFLSPVYGLYAAVTRQTLKGEPREGWFPDQRLTIEEALEAYTRGPAWASFEEDRKGTLARRQAGGHRRLRPRPRADGADEAGRPARGQSALHLRRGQARVRGRRHCGPLGTVQSEAEGEADEHAHLLARDGRRGAVESGRAPRHDAAVRELLDPAAEGVRFRDVREEIGRRARGRVEGGV